MPSDELVPKRDENSVVITAADVDDEGLGRMSIELVLCEIMSGAAKAAVLCKKAIRDSSRPPMPLSFQICGNNTEKQVQSKAFVSSDRHTPRLTMCPRHQHNCNYCSSPEQQSNLISFSSKLCSTQ